MANNSEERELIVEKVKKSSLDQKIITDFIVIHEILNETKVKKIEKIAKSGSLISQINLQDDLINESTLSDDEILEIVGIKQEVKSLEHGFGAPRPKQKIKLRNAIVQLYEIDSSFVFKIGKNRYTVKSPKNLVPSELLNNNKSRFYSDEEYVYYMIGE